MKAPFEPGDVVVCLRDFPGPADQWGPVKGGYYRVEGCVHELFGWFVELAEDPDSFDPDFGWGAQHFRKIDEGVTEEFREVLGTLTPGKPRVRVS